FNYVVNFLFSKAQWSVIRDIRYEFFQTLEKKPLEFHDKQRTGEIMALATFDISMLAEMIDPGLRFITETFLTFVIFVVLIIFQAPVLAIFLAPVLILYIYSIKGYNNKMLPISEFFERKWSQMTISAQDNITGARIVRAFSAEDHETENFRKVVLEFRDLFEKRQILVAKYWPLLMIYILLGGSFLIGIGMVSQGLLSLGELLGYNGLVIILVQPTMNIAWAISILQGGIAGGGRIYRLMHLSEDESDNKLVPFDWSTFKGKVEFRNVSFTYPGASKPTLSNINITIEPGETLALVGASGSGKTTFTKLLLRLYEYSGQILLDGVDITSLSLSDLRTHIGRVEQDIFLFATTIKSNITFGMEHESEITEEEIKKVAKLAQVDEFIETLPDKYNTVLGERGSGLSGGQKQRIAIARCLLTNPKIMILDDTTSAIDSETEEKIARAIAKVMEKRTTFLITHRVSAIRKANKIAFFDNGTIEAIGTHENLLRTYSSYSKIFEQKWIRKYESLKIKNELSLSLGGAD
ncbi:MAG: ABC transporter ATP-binding protein, partial [Candidatus Thorarchaeota archaeon]